MRIGAMRDRVIFQSEVNTPDGGGGNTLAWTEETTVWGSFSPTRGRETLEAGRLEATHTGILIVRSTTETQAVTTAHRVQIEGTDYQIRSISNIDRRERFLEMLVERGVGT